MTGASPSRTADTELVLHIGTPKTGTTYLQGILSQNRAQLAKHGWSYPGRRVNQQHAIYGLCGSDIYYLSDTSRYEPIGEQLLARLTASPTPRTLWSAEVLSQLDDMGLERLLRLTGAPSRVLMTVRGLHALLPSSWQQLLKTGHTETLTDYVDRLEAHRNDRSTREWLGYAFGDVVRRWSQFAPVHVVVVPSRSAGPERLWHLFREAADLPELADLSVHPEGANVSLSTEAAEVLRRLSGELGRHGRKRAQALRQQYLRQAVFPLADGDGGTRITLPPETHDRVRRWNEQELEEVSRFAAAVHGDLADAGFRPHPQQDSSPAVVADVTARQLAALLVEGDWR